MNVLTYTVRLLEPLLATRIDGDPNAGVSYSFVPGSLVRGALAVAYQKRLSLSSLDAADDKTRRLFFAGQTRYLNAYPAGGPDEQVDGAGRALPTPFSWHTRKGEHWPVYDFAVQIPEERGVQYKMVHSSRLFCRHAGGDIVSFSPQRQVTVHTQRDRVFGRARINSGAVFQYDALAAGQSLCGAILLDGEGADELAELLRTVKTLGGSANSGYGRVRIDEIQLLGDGGAEWHETGRAMADASRGEPLVVTLLSDLILRDRVTGLPSTDLCAELSAALNTTVLRVDLANRRSAVRLTKVGGFNRRWGLPLVQSQALAAGSVLVVTADDAWPLEKLRELEWRGIGERRVEGFGRIAFQWQNVPFWPKPEPVTDPARTLTEQSSAVQSSAMGEPPQASPVMLDGNALRLGQWLAERLLRQELDMALQRRVNQLKIEHSPSMAQLNRLRVIARDALPKRDTGRLQEYVSNLERRKSSREQFQQARVDGKRLMRWLEDHLAAPESIWQELAGVQTSRAIGANVQAAAAGALAQEYTIRLIDALFAKAAQDRRQEEDNR